MSFLDELTQITGTESHDGEIRLIRGRITGVPAFVNSGVGLRKELDAKTLDFDTVGEGFDEFFRQGPRILPTVLSMPADCLQQGPHCHPGGEFAYVASGEYFDADMDGGAIETYPEGSVIFYGRGSTHRPLSRDGARILYIPFDGLVFGKDATDLARKMLKIGTVPEAIEYALQWMEPDRSKRRRLQDALTGS